MISSTMALSTFNIKVLVPVLIVAISIGNAGASDVTLCCPVGKHLDDHLSCEQQSNSDEQIIRTFLSKKLNLSIAKVTWSILKSEFKPVTSYSNEWYWPVDHKYCLNFENSSDYGYGIMEVEVVRKLKINMCCPTGQVLNTLSHLCQISSSSSFKVGVQPKHTQQLKFSSYKAEDFDGEVNMIDCSSEDRSYIVNDDKSCIRDYDSFRSNFYIDRKDKLTKSGMGEIQESFEKKDFCLATNQDGHTVARLCHKDLCMNSTCLNKCCEEGEYWYMSPSDDSQNCVAGNIDPVYLPVKDMRGTTVLRNLSSYSFRYGIPICEVQDKFDTWDLERKPKRDFWVLKENASLISANFHTSEAHDLFCFDQGWDGVSEKYRTVGFFCSAIDGSSPPNTDRYVANGSLMIISCIFLLLTIIVHLMLPDLRNVHGISIICSSLSMMINFLIMASLNLQYYPTLGSVTCKAMGVIAYYFFLAAFAWLSVMGIDVYRSFRAASSTRSFSRHKVDFKTLAIYSIIAWGVPGLISSFMVIIDNADLPYYVVTPNFGVYSCWFYDDKTVVGLYLYGPVCIFIVCNILCFMSLARKLYMASRSALKLSPTDERRGRERMWAIVKLFVLMGITWIFEVLSGAIGGPESIWYLTDAINILKPVFVFVIFVCRRKVLDLLGLRYTCIGNFLRRTFDWSPLSRSSTATSGSRSKTQKSSMMTTTHFESIVAIPLNTD